jgi:translocation protein SEC63
MRFRQAKRELTNPSTRLTDEVTRENWLKYNNPDGPQQTEMGIALPPWIIEAQNNIWVLGVYGLIFGGALPALVGRWWFGSRAQTKDGVDASTAAAFFRVIKEESEMSEVVGALGQATEWDLHKSPQRKQQVDALENQIKERLGDKWTELCRRANASGPTHAARRQALVLLYAHLLRLDVEDSTLQKGKPLLMKPLLRLVLISAHRANASPPSNTNTAKRSALDYPRSELARPNALCDAASRLPHPGSRPA